MKTYNLRYLLLAALVAGCGSSGGKPVDDGGVQNCTMMVCGVFCVDPMTDAKNCGGCGKACMQGEVCNAGTCSVTCPNGQTVCGNACADLMNDPKHCGGCNTPCMGNLLCSAGKCGTTCTMPQKACGNMCVNPESDVDNCGDCNSPCPMVANGTRACVAGECHGNCNTGFADCDQSPTNGCETATDGDPKNCGMCGKVCQNVANGLPGCAKGMCGVGSCVVNFGDCDADPTNGCEVSLLGDLKNCGSCGRACPVPANGAPSCMNGNCGIATCNMGFGDCDANPANGCEDALTSDANNCGACGKFCSPAANSTPVCNKSLCGLACNMGFADCDNVMADGCEVNIGTDLKNCGGCGQLCAPANGVATCIAGVCALGGCNQNFADCNMNVADGCETNTKTDKNNCGMCGHQCANNQSCVAGVCKQGLTFSLAAATSLSTDGPWSATAVSLNGDANLDLVVSNHNLNTLSVFFGNGNGTFGAATTYPTGTSPYYPVLRDFNGDGKLDVVVTNRDSNTLSSLLGLGNGTFNPQTTYPFGTTPFTTDVADFNGDGKLDVVTANNTGVANSTFSLLAGNGNGTFQPVVSTASGVPSAILARDWNGDGFIDLAITDQTANTLTMHLGNGNGTFQAPVSYNAGTTAFYLAAGDWNNDGKLDVACTNFGANTVSIFLGNGNGTFQAATTLAAGTNPHTMVTTDLNLDGYPDLICTNSSSNNISVYLGSVNGFLAQQNFAVGSFPRGLDVGDFNNDNKPDIVVANLTSSTLSFLLNTSQ
jgi:hypothetical protein